MTTLELTRSSERRRVHGTFASASLAPKLAWGEELWFDEDTTVDGAHTYFPTPPNGILPEADEAGDRLQYEVGFSTENLFTALSVVRAHSIRVARRRSSLNGRDYLGYQDQMSRLPDHQFWGPAWSSYIPIITFDVDDVFDHTTYNELPLIPNYFGRNPENGHSQGAYYLDAPIAGATNPLRQVVSLIRSGLNVAVGGDTNHVNHMARTPGVAPYEWDHQHDYRYSLQELVDAFGPIADNSPQVRQRFLNLRTGEVEMVRDKANQIMRQMFLFEKGRRIAYARFATGAQIDELWMLHEVLKPLEAELAKLEDREPIPVKKVASIARSIANFCNTKMSRDFARGNGVSFYTHEQQVRGGQTQGRANAAKPGYMRSVVAVRWEHAKEFALPAFPREAALRGASAGGKVTGAMLRDSGELANRRQTSQTVRSFGKIMKAAMAKELKLAQPGLTNGEIAVQLGVTDRTVRTYLNTN